MGSGGVDAPPQRGARRARRGRGGRSRPARWACRGAADDRSVDIRHHHRTACRRPGAVPPSRHRLASRRTPAVARRAARRTRRHRHLRRAIRCGATTDPSVEPMGRGQVRGVRASFRRHQRAVVRRRRAERRTLRTLRVRRCDPRQRGAGREVSRSACRPRTPSCDVRRAPSRRGPGRRTRRSGAV